MKFTATEQNVYNNLIRLEREITSLKNDCLINLKELSNEKLVLTPIRNILEGQLQMIFTKLYSYLGLDSDTKEEELNLETFITPSGKTSFRDFVAVTKKIKATISLFLTKMEAEEIPEEYINRVAFIEARMDDIQENLKEMYTKTLDINKLFTKYREHPSLIEQGVKIFKKIKDFSI